MLDIEKCYWCVDVDKDEHQHKCKTDGKNIVDDSFDDILKDNRSIDYIQEMETVVNIWR